MLDKNFLAAPEELQKIRDDEKVQPITQHYYYTILKDFLQQVRAGAVQSI
jgi:hypothetical protein